MQVEGSAQEGLKCENQNENADFSTLFVRVKATKAAHPHQALLEKVRVLL